MLFFLCSFTKKLTIMYSNNASVNLLFAIQKCWKLCGNKDAANREQILADILYKKSNDIVAEKWNSPMRCKPPLGIEQNLRPLIERYLQHTYLDTFLKHTHFV